jgi:hypothetical protein
LQVVGLLRRQDPSEHPSASRIAAGTPIFPRHEHASRAARIRVAARHCERIEMLELIEFIAGLENQVTVGNDDGGS